MTEYPMNDPEPWIGFDFDGTLATDGGDHSNPEELGEPVPAMIWLVREHLKQGVKVKIFTARAEGFGRGSNYGTRARLAIMQWCNQHIGRELEVTAKKDMYMLAFYDDRAITVETNTGRILTHDK